MKYLSVVFFESIQVTPKREDLQKCVRPKGDFWEIAKIFVNNITEIKHKYQKHLRSTYILFCRQTTRLPRSKRSQSLNRSRWAYKMKKKPCVFVETLIYVLINQASEFEDEFENNCFRVYGTGKTKLTIRNPRSEEEI